MRLLANENIPGDTLAALRAEGHDVIWIRTEYPGATDQEVLQLAQTENRVLLTMDKDFGELAFRSRLPSQCGVILFRIAPSEAPASPGASVACYSRAKNIFVVSVVETENELVEIERQIF